VITGAHTKLIIISSPSELFSAPNLYGRSLKDVHKNRLEEADLFRWAQVEVYSHGDKDRGMGHTCGWLRVHVVIMK